MCNECGSGVTIADETQRRVAQVSLTQDEQKQMETYVNTLVGARNESMVQSRGWRVSKQCGNGARCNRRQAEREGCEAMGD